MFNLLIITPQGHLANYLKPPLFLKYPWLDSATSRGHGQNELSTLPKQNRFEIVEVPKSSSRWNGFTYLKPTEKSVQSEATFLRADDKFDKFENVMAQLKSLNRLKANMHSERAYKTDDLSFYVKAHSKDQNLFDVEVSIIHKSPEIAKTLDFQKYWVPQINLTSLDGSESIRGERKELTEKPTNGNVTLLFKGLTKGVTYSFKHLGFESYPDYNEAPDYSNINPVDIDMNAPTGC